jgi:hypothetical protein
MGGLDMGKPTGAVRQPRTIAAEWLNTYRPHRLEVGTWAAVRPFVLDCVVRLELDGGPGALRVVRVLARLAAWGLGEGLTLEAEVVLDPDTVERFVAMGLSDDRSRPTYRAVLRRVGPLLTKKAPWEPRPASVARRQVALPYTTSELEGLRTDAMAQPTSGRVCAARAILALGCGAGLDGRWVARVAAQDVATLRGAVLVRVGAPSPRVVPVLASWEPEVLDLAATAGDEFLVGGKSLSRNRAGELATSLVVAHGHPKFSASRLRSTWLVMHLAMGTRLPELATAAGLRGVTVLSDLLPFVPALEEDVAVQMLRGAR